MKRRTALALLACFGLAAPAFATDKPVTMRVGDYPPAYYKEKSGEWVGIEIDVFKAVCEEAGIKYQLVEMPWARAVESLKIGELDTMPAMSKTAEREKLMDYIGPSRYEQMVLIVRKENVNLDVKKLDDLLKLPANIGIQTHTEYPNLSERLRTDPGFGKQFEYVSDQNINLKKLSGGRIIGFFEDRNFAIHAIKTLPEYKDFAVHSFALSEPKPVYIVASLKLDDGTRQKMKAAYQRLEQQGRFKKIWKKWED